ncbi:unannotated protein [freshwater metagenome]|uniref:Unannotated protein n=1 Tax=freshwater metagenome TaxID=449393 RepID=A0A6J6ZJF6_9ZZZZ
MGAFVRIAEMIYFKSPLFTLLQSDQMLYFILHLPGVSNHLPSNAGSWEFGGVTPDSQLFYDISVQPKSGLIRFDSGHIYSTRLRRDEFLSGYHWNEVRALIKTKGSYMNESVIILPQANYYYDFFMYELVPLIHASLSNPEMKVLSIDHQPNYVDEVLSLLNVEIIQTSDKVVRVKELVAPRFGALENLSDVLVVKTLFREHLKPLGERRKILVVRGNRARSNVAIEDFLSILLVSHGFTCMDPEKMSLVTQSELFSQATHIVGLHGGALTNMIFSEMGTHVLEIFNHPFRAKSYEYLAKICKHEYSSLDDSTLQFGVVEWLKRTAR